MYFQKEQIVSKISEISQQRYLHDTKISELRELIINNKKYDVVKLRQLFSSYIQELGSISRQNLSILDLLKYRCQKLAKQGIDVVTQLLRIQSLKEYFVQLKNRLKLEQTRGQQIITGRERWELTSKYGQDENQNIQDETQSLVFSAKTAKQTAQMAREVYSNLANQSSRLQTAREKMGSVLQNINLAGNIAQLLRTRTREDNKLIARCSIGLIIWTLICLYILRPLVRGY